MKAVSRSLSPPLVGAKSTLLGTPLRASLAALPCASAPDATRCAGLAPGSGSVGGSVQIFITAPDHVAAQLIAHQSLQTEEAGNIKCDRRHTRSASLRFSSQSAGTAVSSIAERILLCNQDFTFSFQQNQSNRCCFPPAHKPRFPLLLLCFFFFCCPEPYNFCPALHGKCRAFFTKAPKFDYRREKST